MSLTWEPTQTDRDYFSKIGITIEDEPKALPEPDQEPSLLVWVGVFVFCSLLWTGLIWGATHGWKYVGR